jgi:hypothetical protein
MKIHTPTRRIGFWAAVVSSVFALLYIVALVATLTGALEEGPWATAYQLAPSIVLAWSYMLLMACVADAAPSERKIWAMIGFGFALMYSVMNSIVYFTELIVVLPRVLRNEGASVSVLLFEPGKFLFAVNGLAYGFMSLAALFAAPTFAQLDEDEAEARRVHWAMLAHGVIGPFIVGTVVWPPLMYIGALWIVTFPTLGILLAMMFRRVKAKPE